MKKLMSCGVFVCGLLFSLAGAPAQAQDVHKLTLFGGYSYQLNGLGSGSSCEFDFCGFGQSGLHGYTVAATYNFNKNLGLEANFAGHNGSPTILSTNPVSTSNGEIVRSGQDVYTYTFGPKVTLPLGNFALFTHFLVGAMHAHEGFTDFCVPATGGEGCGGTPFAENFKGTGMAFKTGGGLDWNHGRWGIRILEVDYVHGSPFVTGTCSSCSGQTESFNISGNSFELSTGLTVNIR